MSTEPRGRDAEDMPDRPNGYPALPILGLDAEPIGSGDRPTILITGAAGRLGRKLRRAWASRYDLILIDHQAGPDDAEILVADLAECDEHWMGAFHGADAVVHLASNPNPAASWEDLVGPNLDAMANVLNAAVLGAVDRVVFASSSHTMWGYRDAGDGPIGEDLPPRPDGPYGASKLVGERLGLSFANAFELAVIALRVGWVQPDPNRADTLPDDWARSLWLSDRDFCQLFERALWAELDDGFLVANGTSRNRGSRWPIDRAIEALGFEPLDDAFAAAT